MTPSELALGSNGKRPTPPSPERRQKGRSDRWKLKEAQRRFTESRSSACCLYGLAGAVSIDVGFALTARLAGIARCGSPFACPACAPVVRERRAREIDEALAAHFANGGSALFVTPTLQHFRTDALADRYALVSEAFGKHLLKGAPWERRRRRLLYRGLIRAVEVTWGENGWHPHAHGCLLFDRPLTAEEVADFRAWLFDRWAAVVARHGFGELHPVHGVDVRPVRAAGDLAEYLTKVDNGWSAGLELARSDLKRKGMPPVALLREFVETGEVQWLARWREYERATFGKRAIVSSPGLLRDLGVREVSDQEAAAAEGADVAYLRALVESPVWRQLVRAAAASELLTEVEQVSGLLLAMSSVFGRPEALESVPESRGVVVA